MTNTQPPVPDERFSNDQNSDTLGDDSAFVNDSHDTQAFTYHEASAYEDPSGHEDTPAYEPTALQSSFADSATETMDAPPEIPAASDNPIDEGGSSLDTNQDDDHHTAKKKVWIWIGVAIAVIVLLCAICAYFVYYQDKALPGTYVGDKNVAGLTQKQVAQMVSDQQDNIHLSFSSDHGSSKVSLADAGVQLDSKKTADKVFHAKTVGSYLTAPFTSSHIVPTYSIDAKKVVELASTKHLSKDIPDAVDPVNFEVVADKQGTFVIKEGKKGKGISPEDVQFTAEKAAKKLSNTSAKLTLKDVSPLITEKELQDVLAKANKIVDSQVTVGVGDKKVSPDKVQKATWIVIPKDPQQDPTVEKKNVKSWLEEQAKPLIKKPQDGKVFVSSSGKVLAEKPKPVDGQEVSNIDDLSTTISDKVQDGQEAQSQFETKVVKAKSTKKVIADGAEKLVYWAGPNEKWIDINLSNATVTPYIGATKQAGPLGMVSGKPSTPTVTGTFKVWHKTSSQTMEGDNGDGTRYKVDNVLWNTFFHAGYAMHGAPWQGANLGRPGGNRLTGSHGCVNMSVAGARIIYNFAPIGTVVVSHY